jgi:hypothetical protein
LIQNINNIIATINQVTFESHIADQDFLNHNLLASLKSFQSEISFLILSKISMLASIAIPIDKINQAIEANVKTIPKTLIINKTITIYKNNDILAINQDIL